MLHIHWRWHNSVQIHSNVLGDWHYSTNYSPYSIWVWGIFRGIMSVPQNIVMNMNNVIGRVYTNKIQTFFKEDFFFALTPCNLGILLHFCHDLDPLFFFFFSLLLDLFYMKEALQGSRVIASSSLPLRDRF